jgi:2-keto-4-pentenoate hydratase/2-oxohepta-3-ene-1,7-dioic acid hydratase in catechol pathway
MLHRKMRRVLNTDDQRYENKDETMKLGFFNNHKLAVIRNEEVIDVSDVVTRGDSQDPSEVIERLIQSFDKQLPKLQKASDQRTGLAMSGVKMLAPIRRPCNIVCMAANYNDGMFSTDNINAFHKATSSVIGPDDEMILPDVPAKIFECEPELGIVIGKRADNVTEERAMEHVFGYTNIIDGSARVRSVFFQMKSRATFAPMGPYIVTADEIADPQNLRIRSWTNGILMQDFNTSAMAHKIRRCVSWLSSVHVLEPGTVIATGTHHVGLNAMMDKDVFEMETEGLGRLRIKIRDDLRRVWKRTTRGELKHLGIDSTTPQIGGKYADSVT